ncbi:hypothetical protein [Mycobacterium sp.]|uniref:hypothetical protein n=1 Tax=Mycobacterium sp. TaxID=1785 RepID=UPI0025F02E89|nr:hypothetical protein [Mycobacterium sp.]
MSRGGVLQHGTSTGKDITCSADFLFSRNRFDIVITCAGHLAYLVCTEGVLNARAVEDMRLIATLNAFVECSQPPR